MPGPTLLCYDGSPNARVAIEAAGRVLGGGQALVVSAWTPVSADRAALAVPGLAGRLRDAVEELDRIGEEQALERAEQGCEMARAAGFSARPLAIDAPDAVWAALTRVADEHGAETIVLGRRGLSPVSSALLGSVSNAVLQHARRAVLIVPPAESP